MTKLIHLTLFLQARLYRNYYYDKYNKPYDDFKNAKITQRFIYGRFEWTVMDKN